MDDNSGEKNYVKQEIYANMKENLKKAMRAGFYYEAIFIEYAIIEDRCASLLKHADVKCIDSKGYELKLASKLNKLRGNPKFVVPYVRKRIPLEFIDRIDLWKKQRDIFIHSLAKIPYDDENVMQVATEGNEIVRILDNKSKSINRFFDKQE
jgi:hypothetical protein